MTPIVEPKASKGNGKGKGAPVGQLKNLAGGLDKENAVGAFGKLSGNSGGFITKTTKTVKSTPENTPVNISGLTAEQVRRQTAEYEGVDLF